MSHFVSRSVGPDPVENPSTFSRQFVAWWSVERLQKLLLLIGSQFRNPGRLTIYILLDAMDESELSNRRRITMSILELGRRSPDWPIVFKVLVASRPDSTTDIASDSCVRMVLENHTENDIQKFVDVSLVELAKQVPSLQVSDRLAIRKSLVEKSQGVFLWVKLVLLEFEEKYNNEGCTVQEVENILLSIPPGLDALYRWMFKPISMQTDGQRRETDAIFCWAGWAAWAAYDYLSDRAVNDVTAIAACGSTTLTTSTLLRNRLRTTKEVEKRVAIRCSNFIEWKHEDSDSIFTFIHVTALQFVTDHYDFQRTVELQQSRYLEFLVNYDPSWARLVSFWPTFSIEQLKATDLGTTLHLYDVIGLPLLKWVRYQYPSDMLLADDLPENMFSSEALKPSAMFLKIVSTLTLAAAVQVHTRCLDIWCEVGTIGLSKQLCFEVAMDQTNQSPISVTAIPIGKWFNSEKIAENVARFDRVTLFCDMLNVATMFASPYQMPELCSASMVKGWCFPHPWDSDGSFYYLSSARYGNLNLARLLFLESRSNEFQAQTQRKLADSSRTWKLAAATLGRHAHNIISIAIDSKKMEFANMMFDEGYVDDLQYIDTPDQNGKTALDRACEQNLASIVRFIWPKYANSSLDRTGIETLYHQAYGRGFMDICRIFEKPVQGRWTMKAGQLQLQALSEDLGNLAVSVSLASTAI